MKKIKVGIIYGGDSCEHEVSLMTADSILKNIDREKFKVVEISVDKQGNFDHKLLDDIDIAFLAFHGENYEDGKFQEFLGAKNIKYSGSGVLASEINMNKDLQKRYFREAGLKTANFITVTAKDSINQIKKIIDETIGYPCILKPTNTGSSLGITKVENSDQISKAISEANKISADIIIEQFIKDRRELEVGVLGNDNLIVSDPGEVLTHNEVYSYEAKYFKPFKTSVEAKNLSEETVAKIKDWVEKAYRATGCRGYSRIDFFLAVSGELYINEINTLPGFTKISMFPKLMLKMGISYKDLITKIIELGLE